MLPLGPSPETVAARKERGAAFLNAARKRVLQRHGVSEDDIAAMTDEERGHSSLGGEILFEIVHSDFAKAYNDADKKLSALEDKRDVEARVQVILDINAATPYPYPPKMIKLLTRRKFQRIKDYSYNCYYHDVFGTPSDTTWQPDIDRQAVIREMVDEMPHKEAFRIVGEITKSEKAARLRRIADAITDIPKYIMYAVVLVCVLTLLSLAGDVLSYLHKAPTVRLLEKILGTAWAWIFTDEGLMTCAALLVLSFLLRKTTQYLRRISAQRK